MENNIIGLIFTAFNTTGLAWLGIVILAIVWLIVKERERKDEETD